MAAVNTVYRLVFGGRLFADESWSCTLHTDGNQFVTLPATAFQTAIAAWVSRVDSAISSAAHLDYIKYNRVQKFTLPTGKFTMRYAEATTVEHQQLDMAIGVKSLGPGQLSNVVTLRTALSRGRGHVGRIYPPTSGIATAPDGRIEVTAAAAQAASAATLIRELNTVLAAQGTTSVVVLSTIGQVVNNVQTVSVGRVTDTLRSRRSSLKEEHVNAMVNP